MSNATAKNEIQEVLQEEFMGRRKAEKVADEIIKVIQSEPEFNVGFAMEKLLRWYLKKDDVRTLLETLTEKQIIDESLRKIKLSPFETFTVEGSSSKIYERVFAYKPTHIKEYEFQRNLISAVYANVETFEIPVCDPSIDEEGNLQFVRNKKPAVDFSYTELEKLAEKSGLKFGTFNQYYLFLGTLAYRMIYLYEYSDSDTMYRICRDSAYIGNYMNAHYEGELELTGSRDYGKCDLGNTRKILEKDPQSDGIWVAGGSYKDRGRDFPLAKVELKDSRNISYEKCVGWFVIK